MVFRKSSVRKYGRKLLNLVCSSFVISAFPQMVETECTGGLQVTGFDRREDATDKRFDNHGFPRSRRVPSGMKKTVVRKNGNSPKAARLMTVLR